MKLGIDAFNLRLGGGVSHIRQLLASADPAAAGISTIVIWGNRSLLDSLPERDWLKKATVPHLELGLPLRILWHEAFLACAVRSEGCDALFSPGGLLPRRGGVRAYTMSRNLLPFERHEARRYPISDPMRLKLELLKRWQARSMERADGVIFLTQYAREVVLGSLAHPPRSSTIIPHGLDDRFFCAPRVALPLDAFSVTRPFRLLYVSSIDFYKHPWHVATAVASLRRTGVPVAIDFVGPTYPGAARLFHHTLAKLDPSGEFLKYLGPLPFDELHLRYRQADAFVYASSCENLPNILLEAMAAGLPIACSNLGPMPEVLGDTGLYFNPEFPSEIEKSLSALIADPNLRSQLAAKAYQRAREYSWKKCADQTFAFIAGHSPPDADQSG